MKINKRLLAISKYIDDFSNIIDVGCDHALLCIYLEKNKKGIKSLASDVNKGPLEQAKKNLKLYKTKNIKLKLGDGISTIEDYTDVVIISGMGGNSMVDILYNDIDKLNNIKRIVLSPNNEFYNVRKMINNIGYNIICEEVICANNKFYPIIVFEKGNLKYNENELKYGINVLKNEDYVKYLNDLIIKYENIIKKLPDKFTIKKEEISKSIKYIYDILNDM